MGSRNREGVSRLAPALFCDAGRYTTLVSIARSLACLDDSRRSGAPPGRTTVRPRRATSEDGGRLSSRRMTGGRKGIRSGVDVVARDYDRLAESYARELGDELTHKPLDRTLLRYLVDQVVRGPIGDLGCGPGHVTRYLSSLGAEVVGVDLSPAMIRQASAEFPHLRFLVGDLRRLPLADDSLAGAIAFYSLIHFEDDRELRMACSEIARVLAPGGEAIVAYHRGNRVVHPGAMWGTPVELGFRFLPDRTVVGALRDAGLETTARIHREPRRDVEHPSRRTYLVASKAGDDRWVGPDSATAGRRRPERVST
jgi:SAM-dependent methyltransferase